MYYRYFSSINDQDYLGRILLFFKRNWSLYIIDFVILILLAIPPYSWHEAAILISISLVLSVRDIFLLKLATYHLGKFIVDGNSVSIITLKKSILFKKYEGLISEFDIVIKGKLWFTKALIYKNNELIHCQYAIGDWSPFKLRELYEHFYQIKRDIGFWRMFKGPMVN